MLFPRFVISSTCTSVFQQQQPVKCAAHPWQVLTRPAGESFGVAWKRVIVLRRPLTAKMHGRGEARKKRRKPRKPGLKGPVTRRLNLSRGGRKDRRKFHTETSPASVWHQFQPMLLSRRAELFHHPRWLYEIKWDGGQSPAQSWAPEWRDNPGHSLQPVPKASELTKALVVRLESPLRVIKRRLRPVQFRLYWSICYELLLSDSAARNWLSWKSEVRHAQVTFRRVPKASASDPWFASSLAPRPECRYPVAELSRRSAWADSQEIRRT